MRTPKALRLPARCTILEKQEMMYTEGGAILSGLLFGLARWIRLASCKNLDKPQVVPIIYITHLPPAKEKWTFTGFMCDVSDFIRAMGNLAMIFGL